MPELQPDPDQIDYFLERIREQPVSSMAWGLGYMHAWTTQASQDHGSDCDVAGCRTCDYFRRALSLFAAYSIEHPPTAEQMERIPRLGGQQ